MFHIKLDLLHYGVPYMIHLKQHLIEQKKKIHETCLESTSSLAMKHIATVALEITGYILYI